MQEDVVTVLVRFGIDTSLGLYQDTLYFTEEEWIKRDTKAIEQTKQSLADVWIIFRSKQITDEEVAKTIEGKQSKIADLSVKIQDLTVIKEQLEAELNG